MRHKKPFISVIIPAYNEEKYIGPCLNALKQQQGADPFEIILCDNHSTDKTRRIASRYSNIIVIEESAKGYRYAIRTAINHATGKVLAVIDTDTRVPIDWIKNITKIFKDHQHVICAGGPVTFYDGTELQNFAARSVQAFFHFIHHIQPMGSNLAVRANIYQRVKHKIRNTSLQWDRHLVKSIQSYGSVMFTEKLAVQISARRWRSAPIIIKEALRRGTNSLAIALLHRTIFTDFQDYR